MADAKAVAGRRAEALLRDAIEDVLRAASRWLWLVLAMGVVGLALVYGLMQAKMYIIGDVTATHSGDSLRSVAAFWMIVAAMSVALKCFQEASVSAMSGYAARRLAVPAVLSTAQRPGRPETLASGAIGDIETLRTSLAGPVSAAVVDMLTTPLAAIVFAFVAMFCGGVREEVQRGFIVHRFDGFLGGGLISVAFYSVLFGLGHFEQGWDATIATGCLGAIWGLVYWRRRSIIAPVVSHAGFNLAQIVKAMIWR